MFGEASTVAKRDFHAEPGEPLSGTRVSRQEITRCDFVVGVRWKRYARMLRSGQPGDWGSDEGSKKPIVRAASGTSLKKAAYWLSGAVSKVSSAHCLRRNAEGCVGRMSAIFSSYQKVRCRVYVKFISTFSVPNTLSAETSPPLSWTVHGSAGTKAGKANQ